ncbi:dynein axonemal heavy chain 11 isoform 2-T7 [Acridotheres tristis]
MEHLVNGMQKLSSERRKAAAFQVNCVEDLKLKLATQEADWQLKNQDTLIAQMGFQTEKLSQEKAIADAEELKLF